MKLHISIFVTFFCLPFISFANEPTTIWAKAWGGPSSESARILSLDNVGNIFVAGSTDGTFKLGETTIVNSNTRMSTSYLAKYSPSGEVIWVRGATTGTYSINGITNDINGNTYIAGNFTSPTLELGQFILTNATPVIYPSPIGMQYDKAFVAKYSPTGDLIWAITPDKEISSRINHITFDKGGIIYITGSFRDNQIEFGGIIINNPNFNPNPQLSQGSLFIMKLDLQGNALWGKSLVDKTILTLSVDKDRNIILGGTFNSSTTKFDNISIQNPDNGFNNIFLTKLSTYGEVLWAKSIGSNKNDNCSSITTDIDGNIIIGGSFSGTTLTVGAGLPTIINNSKTSKNFLLKCNPEGDALWIKASENGGGNGFGTICTDKYKNIYTSGNFTGNFSFENISLINKMTRGNDIFVLKFNSDGTIVWAINYGDTEYVNASSCLIDNKEDICITGGFSNRVIDFNGCNAINYSYKTEGQTLDQFPISDAFLVKIKQPVDSIIVMYCSTNNTATLSIADSAKIYNWMNSSGQSLGDKSKLTISNPIVGDTYSCQITYNNGSSKTLSTTIIEYKLIPDFNTTTDCKTNYMQFSESIISSHLPTEIMWDFGDGTKTTRLFPEHKYNKTGKYKVRIEVTNPLSACAEIFEKEVEFIKINGFTVSKKQIDSRNNQIEVNAEYNPKLQYTFDMGDGTTKQGANNVHTYNIDNATPEYIIKLTTINETNGCKNEYSESIDVVPFIPNIFTPNADGINDIFAANLDLIIIDRNGIKIYQGKNGWDGNYNGRKAPTDTYSYLAKYPDKHGNIQSKKGVVSLIR